MQEAHRTHSCRPRYGVGAEWHRTDVGQRIVHRFQRLHQVRLQHGPAHWQTTKNASMNVLLAAIFIWSHTNVHLFKFITHTLSLISI